ncbi:hypothetical protein RZS08_32900, partial [Arthrospira platensis SPKY1]|nr:hypothetical protein [Arthrospira platensis SPKY1]
MFRLRFGAPAPASLFITDDDISISDPQGFTPFPGLQETANAISVTYREPGSLWQSKGAPPVLDPALEAEDGGRRLMASLSLDAVFNRRQAMQVARGYIKDERRFRTHQIVLPADAQVLEA